MPNSIEISELKRIAGSNLFRKGKECFREGQVIDCIEAGQGRFDAIVADDDEYQVSFQIEDNALSDLECSCNSTQGALCEHIVAAILYAQGATGKSKQGPKKAKERKTLQEQAEELLMHVPIEELQSLLAEICEQRPDIRRMFLNRCIQFDPKYSNIGLKDQIKLAFKKADLYRSYPNEATLSNLHNDVEKNISAISLMAQQGELKSAWACAILLYSEVQKGVYKVAQFKKVFQGTGVKILNILQGMIQNSRKLEKEAWARQSIDRLLQQPYALFGDSFLGLLALRGEFISSEADAVDFRQTTTLCIRQNHPELRAILKLWYEIECGLGEKDSALQVISESPSHPLVKEFFIERSIESSDYEHAKELVSGMDPNDHRSGTPHLLQTELRLKIALAAKDLANARSYARQLTLYPSHEQLKFLRLFKVLIPANEWELELKRLLAEMKVVDSRFTTQMYINFCLEENYMKGLLDLLARAATLETLQDLEKYLVPEFKAELVKLFLKIVEQSVDAQTRHDYNYEMPYYIRKIQSWGGQAEANELIQRILKKYPNRYFLQAQLKPMLQNP